MSEPQIVPPTPTVVVPSTGPVDNSPGLEQVQRAFDRAYPDMNPKATAAAAAAPPDAPPQPEPPPPPQAEPEMRKMPSFLEQQLTSEAPPKLPEPEPDADFPEDLPPEQKQSRIKGLREAYKKLKNENETLRSTPAQDDGQRQRMEALENRNKQMQAVLQRMGVEQHTEFQQQVIAPMTQAWQTAAGIVQEAGGDPEALARAVQLQGKEHFEALDEVFDELPESAKMEAHQAIAAYKRLDKVRQKALADAPKTYEALHKRDLEREYQNVNKQRAEMGNIFDDAVRTLREEAKVEVLQRSNDPDAKWWNDQADAVEGIARQLYMENTDMRKMAMAVLMAPMADVYRKLWMQERANNAKNNDMIKERYGAEPYIGSGGGNNGSPDLQMKEDLKRPFNEVFLREFHRAKARNNR